ncbi:MAG: helix-turn-helix domain-containing protein [Hahellaceae bacterium]|jgi:transcriptional regulator with XRE-family HTH domain|nr:helix-turn-helix domain-containing protein [Hahellaceae bacterium]MCP5211877.1 helix-turn-helix domain-containing protein [Hahellaceae bacterium]
MAETQLIVNTLKKALKKQGVTYQKVAMHLDMSESSVKRLFSGGDFTLKRLGLICQIIDLELSDLFRMVEEAKHYVRQLSRDQETLLVSDTRLLLVAVCVTNRWSYDEILATYNLDEHEVIQALAKLDRLKLIELQPHNRVKLLISADFQWIKNGPIEEFFSQQVQTDFFNSRFRGKGEIRLFVSGMLTRESNALMIRKIQRLSQEFNQLKDEDQSQPLTAKFGTSLCVAMRPWELATFEAMRKQDSKSF